MNIEVIRIKPLEEIEKTITKENRNFSWYHAESNLYVVAEMKLLCGKVLKVSELRKTPKGVEVVQAGGWIWHSDWFTIEEASLDEENTFIIEELNQMLDHFLGVRY